MNLVTPKPVANHDILFNKPASRLLRRGKFRIDVTFEMRTVLSIICLSNDNLKIVTQQFIINGNGGEESRIEERQRESVCERQHMVEEER
jgi:hypothetical protein